MVRPMPIVERQIQEQKGEDRLDRSVAEIIRVKPHPLWETSCRTMSRRV